MKIGVVFFHSNIRNIYKDRWIEKSINSMLQQSNKDFSIYEIDYSGNNESLLNNCNNEKKFWSVKLENYAAAMNFIISNAFQDECDYVFNTNLDDYYDQFRIESQINLMISNDYDIVSSDFCYIKEDENQQDIITQFMNITRFENIYNNLVASHNVIAHPSVCYNKRFWADPENRYDPNKVPSEDLDLWQKSIKKGYKFGIDKNLLLYYRRHDNQVSSK